MRAYYWAALWRSENRLSGVTEHLIYESMIPKLFLTRSDARKYIDEHYGCIRKRPDLQQEPHGWKIPIPIKVSVHIVGIMSQERGKY